MAETKELAEKMVRLKDAWEDDYIACIPPSKHWYQTKKAPAVTMALSSWTLSKLESMHFDTPSELLVALKNALQEKISLCELADKIWPTITVDSSKQEKRLLNNIHYALLNIDFELNTERQIEGGKNVFSAFNFMIQVFYSQLLKSAIELIFLNKNQVLYPEISFFFLLKITETIEKIATSWFSKRNNYLLPALQKDCAIIFRLLTPYINDKLEIKAEKYLALAEKYCENKIEAYMSTYEELEKNNAILQGNEVAPLWQELNELLNDPAIKPYFEADNSSDDESSEYEVEDINWCVCNLSSHTQTVVMQMKTFVDVIVKVYRVLDLIDLIKAYADAKAFKAIPSTQDIIEPTARPTTIVAHNKALDPYKEAREQKLKEWQELVLLKKQANEKRAIVVIECKEPNSKNKAQAVDIKTQIETLTKLNLNKRNLQILDELINNIGVKEISFNVYDYQRFIEALGGEIINPGKGGSHYTVKVGNLHAKSWLIEDVEEITGGNFRPHGKDNNDCFGWTGLKLARSFIEDLGFTKAGFDAFNQQKMSNLYRTSKG